MRIVNHRETLAARSRACYDIFSLFSDFRFIRTKNRCRQRKTTKGRLLTWKHLWLLSLWWWPFFEIFRFIHFKMTSGISYKSRFKSILNSKTDTVKHVFFVFFFKREIFMSRNVLCNSLKTALWSTIYHFQDSETVVTASVSN